MVALLIGVRLDGKYTLTPDSPPPSPPPPPPIQTYVDVRNGIVKNWGTLFTPVSIVYVWAAVIYLPLYAVTTNRLISLYSKLSTIFPALDQIVHEMTQ